LCEVSDVKQRVGYKGYVIEALAIEQRDGGFSVEFYIEEHESSGMTVTQFYLPTTFPMHESAIEAAIHAGRQKIDEGFERGKAVASN